MTSEQLYAALRDMGVSVESADAAASAPLSPKQRVAVLLHARGYDSREIAARAGCAKWEIARIRERVGTNCR